MKVLLIYLGSVKYGWIMLDITTNFKSNPHFKLKKVHIKQIKDMFEHKKCRLSRFKVLYFCICTWF